MIKTQIQATTERKTKNALQKKIENPIPKKNMTPTSCKKDES